jgi:hypothetical protein
MDVPITPEETTTAVGQETPSIDPSRKTVEHRPDVTDRSGGDRSGGNRVGGDHSGGGNGATDPANAIMINPVKMNSDIPMNTPVRVSTSVGATSPVRVVGHQWGRQVHSNHGRTAAMTGSAASLKRMVPRHRVEVTRCRHQPAPGGKRDRPRLIECSGYRCSRLAGLQGRPIRIGPITARYPIANSPRALVAARRSNHVWALAVRSASHTGPLLILDDDE